MKTIFKLGLCVAGLVWANTASAQSQPLWLGGKLSNITSVTTGLLIRFEGDVTPPGCTSSNPWMLVKSDYPVMISVILTHWMAGRLDGTVYVDDVPNGYCEVNQYDPH